MAPQKKQTSLYSFGAWDSDAGLSSPFRSFFGFRRGRSFEEADVFDDPPPPDRRPSATSARNASRSKCGRVRAYLRISGRASAAFPLALAESAVLSAGRAPF